jgi:hypothetical protein
VLDYIVPEGWDAFAAECCEGPRIPAADFNDVKISRDSRKVVHLHDDEPAEAVEFGEMCDSIIQIVEKRAPRFGEHTFRHSPVPRR